MQIVLSIIPMIATFKVPNGKRQRYSSRITPQAFGRTYSLQMQALLPLGLKFTTKAKGLPTPSSKEKPVQ
jgi:hypothetical protein